MDILEFKPSADEAKTETAEPLSSSAVSVLASPIGSDHPSLDEAIDSASNEADLPAAKATDLPKKQAYQRRRKLYQALARVEGELKIKGDDLVLITKGDKAELVIVQIVGKHTAMRLLKRPENRRQGIYSLYPQVQGMKIINFLVDDEQPDSMAPPTDQMFISGKLARNEETTFFVDIGRNKRTHKARKQIDLPLEIEGNAADPSWRLGQWIGLVLHRQGAKWIWQGDTRAVLKSSGSTEIKKES